MNKYKLLGYAHFQGIIKAVRIGFADFQQIAIQAGQVFPNNFRINQASHPASMTHGRIGV